MDWPAKPYLAPNTLHVADAFELLAALPDASVDMCLTDMPYGTTACSWDTVIDLALWWAEMRRVMKPRGAVVCTASQPFTTKLISSNYEWFSYVWCWNKKYISNPLIAKRQPLRTHEDIIVFGNKPRYFPVMRERPKAQLRPRNYTANPGQQFGVTKSKENSSSKKTMYPITILNFDNGNPFSRKRVHPTQKPVALFEYLIKTYTQKGELVIDPFLGSGTTALASYKTKRKFICGDQDESYIKTANIRIRELKNPISDLPLFAELENE